MPTMDSPFLIFVGIVILLFSLSVIFKSRQSKSKQKAGFAIPDHFQTLDQVQAALRRAGLESSNLILGIDYTASNTWTGTRTFGGNSLHLIQPERQNPYQAAISIIEKTLEVHDDDKLIPTFGFGDASTSDHSVFPFFPDRPCFGFNEVLTRYNEITPNVQLAGPTSFAPVIREAIEIVKQNRNSYHILVIVADGQVTDPRQTVNAIVEASKYPLSIVLVGVGDGPWDTMEEFDDGLPQRQFDNFQFVNFHEMMTRYDGREAPFAVAALQEIPLQFQEIKRLGLLAK